MPSPDTTATKLVTSFFGYSQPADRTKRQISPVTEDIVIVMDGSMSIGDCEFKRGKEALENMIKEMRDPKHDPQYAAVTFSDTANINFKFLPSSLASREITTISYPDAWTNTQAGLAKAKELFDDPSSGIFYTVL